ncbi:DUF3574 domain-containing protein [Xenorhabdus sp. KK7.4]|uniref:DUF3574 domain-containing protein n=1 Tax=Xenorhabdus sp. KK7.4 TaxID=1851572 RepID=UPI000C04AB2C|nr:DUF3574 domain-containing protein [Xenorhabdus sp. KK7.4]PHM51626.1 hypothetical protein Xekk_03562 [Xenorhabdus sp. KK7.4]
MKNTPILVAAAITALLLSSCAVPNRNTISPTSSQVCRTGDPMIQTTLYFGLNRPSGPVITAAEWQTFIDQQVTPRFKDGLSVFDAKGQWLGNNGKLARENSKALLLIHTQGKKSETNIEALRSSYKQQFVQDSVMRVDAPVCVAF